MVYIITETNTTVTNYYFNILKQSAELVTKDVRVVDDIKKINNYNVTDIIVVGSILKAFTLLLRGYKNIVVWFQGAVPEESYMKNKSKIRMMILEIIEKYVLKKSALRIFVSEAMKSHYEDKYNLNFSDKYYLMPCYNTELHKDSFFTDNKYNHNIFVYAGGLSVWQCFDETLRIYKIVEDLNYPNTKLLVLTPEKEKAKDMILKSSIKNYEIDYVPVEQLPRTLSNAKFGFIIRDHNVVNKVATPTKLSTYLSNGLIPIYSDVLNDFHINTENFIYKVSIDTDNYIDKVKSLMSKHIKPLDIYNEYDQLFQSYYNTNIHERNLSSKIKALL